MKTKPFVSKPVVYNVKQLIEWPTLKTIGFGKAISLYLKM